MMMVDYLWSDFNHKWRTAHFCNDDQKETLHKELFEVLFPELLRQIDLSLDGTKFLVSDQLTIYDMHIAGHFYNIFLNPNAKHKEQWQAAYAKATDKVKAYIEAFGVEMKEYLDSRVQTCTL